MDKLDIRIMKNYDGFYYASVFNGAYAESLDKDVDVVALVYRCKREYAWRMFYFDSASGKEYEAAGPHKEVA